MRRLGLFALIFAVLAGVYLLLERPAGKRGPQDTSSVLSSLVPADIEHITIVCPGTGTALLQRTGTAWQVSAALDQEAYPADSSAVQALLETLAGLSAASPVSRNPARHALYGVSPETGLRIDMLGKGGTGAGLMIGKTGPNIFSTYVRSADSDDVFLIDGILQSASSKTLNEWRDKSVFSLDPELVRSYTISGDMSLSLQKSDGTWQSDTGEDINAEAAAQAVRTFARLSAADFAEVSPDDAGLAEPSRTITAELADGTRAVLLLGKDANAFQQYAKTPDADTVYIIEKFLLNSLCPTGEDLIAQ